MAIVMIDANDQPETTFAGQVLTTREQNFYDDSDFYALVWNEETQQIERIQYASTRYASYGNNAIADATPEVIAKANAYAYRFLRKLLWASFIENLKKPTKGDKVKVIKGRKAPVGTVGTLFWIGQTQTFGGYSAWSQKASTKAGIGIGEKGIDGRFDAANVMWTYVENLEADVCSKFKVSEAKRKLASLKRSGWSAFLAWQAAPLAFFG
jgi:hypothetical protein